MSFDYIQDAAEKLDPLDEPFIILVQDSKTGDLYAYNGVNSRKKALKMINQYLKQHKLTPRDLMSANSD